MTQRRFSENERCNWLWEIGGNVVVASLFGFFAYSFCKEYLASFRTSILLLFIKESLDALFYLCRRTPKEVTFRPLSWMMAIGGTITPLLLRPAGTADSIVGSTILFAGMSLQILAILSLNRSFGMVPANRGIKKNGMYQFVRHPLYASYAITHVGFIISNVTWSNVCLFILATTFQIARINREEEFLSRDEEYQEYSKKIRWKIAPFIF